MVGKRKIPINVIRLAGGYKASREGKDRNIATQEIIDALPAMGLEIDTGTEAGPGTEGDLSKTQPYRRPGPSSPKS